MEKDKDAYPAFDALRASWQLACALEALYAAGYCHLDIKPANILQKGDTTVLSDFGLAFWNSTPALTRMVCTLYYRPPFLRWVAGSVHIPNTRYMPTDVYSLGLTLMELVCGTNRPDLGLYYTKDSTEREREDGENRFVVDQQKEAHAFLDRLIAWLPTQTDLARRRQRWNLPLFSVDAFVAYLQLLKEMTSATPTSLSPTDVRLRLEALWPAHPPAPVLRLEADPPVAEQWRAAATALLSTQPFVWMTRVVPHTLRLFLSVMVFATPSEETYALYEDGDVSWRIPYLHACLNIVLSFYGVRLVRYLVAPFREAWASLYDTTHITSVSGGR